MYLNCFLVYTQEFKDTINIIESPEKYFKIHKYELGDVYNKINNVIIELNAICYITIGKNELFKIFEQTQYKQKWLHYNDISDYKSQDIVDIYSNLILKTDNSTLISVITSTYNSGSKIMRPYNSLMNQTYTNWEWIIWDDSPDENTYNMLLDFAKNDIRIRVYKQYRQSGYIGEMKELSSKLARGKWIVEVDHDDEFIPDLFKWMINIENKYPDVGFIYSDCSEPFEGINDSVYYGEMPAFGFGSYIKAYKNGFYQNVFQINGPNPIVLQHIVGVPNHVRIWKTELYNKIGCHNYNLPVVDDYELYIRTFLNTKMCRISENCYLQYRNTDGNFTFFRNELIQYLSGLVYSLYKNEINDKFTDLGIDTTIKSRQPDYYYLNFEYPQLDYIYKPKDDLERCFSIVISVHDFDDYKLDNIIDSLINQTYKNWELFIIGNRCPKLEQYMNTLLDKIDKSIIENNIRWYNLLQYESSLTLGLNYAIKKCVTTEWLMCIELDTILKPKFLETVNEKINENIEYLIIDDVLINKYSLYVKHGLRIPNQKWLI